MSTVVSGEPRIQDVRVTEDEIVAHLADGRVIAVPLAWSWRLSEATPAQRTNFRIIGIGQGVHWPDVDEDISVEGLLHGSPAPRPKAGKARNVSRLEQPHQRPNKRTQAARKKRTTHTVRRSTRG